MSLGNIHTLNYFQSFLNSFIITCFARNFSLPFLLFGDVRRGRLQQGHIYPS